MKRMLILTVTTVLLAGTFASAQTAAGPAGAAAAKDFCAGLIDPYDPTAQRNLFLKSAGVDNELTADEFSAARAKDDTVAARFDKWELMLQFDKNDNKMLDWFEMDAYRREVRKLILEAFDANHDGHLTGAEREAANRSLAAGKVPGLERRRDEGGGSGKGIADRREEIKKYDKDGDGKLSDTERRAMAEAYRIQREEELKAGKGGAGPGGQGREGENKGENARSGRGGEFIQKYDKDGDGKLNDDERRAMFEDIQKKRREETFRRFDKNGDGKITGDERAALDEQAKTNMEAAGVRWGLRDFDTDGDGALNEEEQAAADKFGRKFADMGQQLRDRMMDLNGDGQVTEEEKAEANKQFRDAGLKMLARTGQYMDADGDGQVSPEERRDFDLRVRTGMIRYLDEFGMRFDADKNGRLSPAEREKLIEGVKANFGERIAKADADGDGRLSGDEFIKLMEGFGKDIGIVPVRKEEK